MKTEKEWREHIRLLLPEKASANIEAEPDHKEDLGCPLIIYGRESVEIEPFDYYSAALGAPSTRKTAWGSRCRCTECGETFTAGWKDGNILLLELEDGQLIEGWTSGENYEDTEIKNGEMLYCPLCGAHAKLIKRTTIATNGYTFRTQVSELIRIEDTTVLMFWMASRRLHKGGYTAIEYAPREAIAISPGGKLFRFSHASRFMYAESGTEEWKYIKTYRDPELISWSPSGSSCYGRKIGGYSAKQLPEMKGSTGEKTGIDAYWGNQWPGTYLKIWKSYPNVENLARTATGILADVIGRETGKTNGRGLDVPYFGTFVLDLKKAKPHEMLGLTKTEFKFFAGKGTEPERISAYKEYTNKFKTSPAEFLEFFEWFTPDQIKSLTIYSQFPIPKVKRYLEKHREPELPEHFLPSTTYIDYLIMIRRVAKYNNIALTYEEYFPKDLLAAHDRASEMQKAIQLEEEAKRQEKDTPRFLEKAKEYEALEWTDGTFCIILPRSAKDLINEGHVLHHCVGGYTEQHLNGKPVFFVRHARRPERSWFTLNENLTGKEPNRIQLHGYRNECCGDKRLNIPNDVLEFCSRWERDILNPWFQNNKNTIRRKAANE